MKLPHEGVYVRLGLSALHGIGVFAIRPIPAGTDIFANDRVPLVWVSKAALAAAKARGTKLGKPKEIYVVILSCCSCRVARFAASFATRGRRRGGRKASWPRI